MILSLLLNFFQTYCGTMSTAVSAATEKPTTTIATTTTMTTTVPLEVEECK